MKKSTCGLVLVLAFGLLSSGVRAAAGADPKVPVPEAAPTLEVVAQFLEGYSKDKTKEQGGWLQVPDLEANETLKLRLDKIHRERLSKVGDRAYFVCADFLNAEGKRYDLDFWVKNEGGKLAVTNTSIHKVSGVPRYIWVEREGLWVQLPV